MSRHVGGGEFVIFKVEGVIFGFFGGRLKDRIWSTCILCTHKVTMRVPSVPPTNLAGFVFYILTFILFDILIMLVVGNSQKYVSRCTKCNSNSFILGERLRYIRYQRVHFINQVDLYFIAVLNNVDLY